MKEFLRLCWQIPEEHQDMAAGALCELDLMGIDQSFDEFCVNFEAARSASEWRRISEAHFAGFNLPYIWRGSERIFDRNWNEEWERGVQPVRINERIMIVPEHLNSQVDAPIKVLISPKMSFGTGHHATTRLMAALLETIVRPGSSWVDAGAGTGVLAILAVRLGARSVLAFDNDEWAVANLKENISRNNVEHSVQELAADVNTVDLPAVDGITANLHRNLLLDNLARFREALSAAEGNLLVSGILHYDADDVVRAATGQHFALIESAREDEWSAMRFQALSASGRS